VWAAIAVLSCGCGASGRTGPLQIDLLHELPRALIQAPASSPGPHVDLVPAESGLAPALVTPAPSRVTWTLQLTQRAELVARAGLMPDPTATVAQGVTLRVGISDNRSYDELLRMKLDPAPAGSATPWRPILLDLSEFSGWKWSVFYQPPRKTWKLIINADATPGGTAAWEGLVVRARSSLK